MPEPKKSLEERIRDTEVFAARALADANQCEEQGQHTKAEKRYSTAQFWHDRWILLTEQGERRPAKG